MIYFLVFIIFFHRMVISRQNIHNRIQIYSTLFTGKMLIVFIVTDFGDTDTGGGGYSEAWWCWAGCQGVPGLELMTAGWPNIWYDVLRLQSTVLNPVLHFSTGQAGYYRVMPRRGRGYLWHQTWGGLLGGRVCSVGTLYYVQVPSRPGQRIVDDHHLHRLLQ